MLGCYQSPSSLPIWGSALYHRESFLRDTPSRQKEKACEIVFLTSLFRIHEAVLLSYADKACYTSECADKSEMPVL